MSLACVGSKKASGAGAQKEEYDRKRGGRGSTGPTQPEPVGCDTALESHWDLTTGSDMGLASL